MSQTGKITVDKQLLAMNRMGDIIDERLMDVLRENAEPSDETPEQRMERLERALIRQKLVVAFLLSTIVSELGRDAIRGPRRIITFFLELTQGTEEDWQEQLAASKNGANDSTAGKEPATPEAVAAEQLLRQRRREVTQQARRRARMMGR